MKLIDIYNKLLKTFGYQNWWPGKTKIEIIVGAILTQNTAWKNVEKAILNLKKGRVLSVRGLTSIPEKRLAELVRPSGYYNQKAKKLKNFISFLNKKYKDSLKMMSSVETDILRKELLSVNGIGKETADSILLYALERPVFVIDAYTRRIFSRHKVIDKNWEYDKIQQEFETKLPPDLKIYNDFHAQIVVLGKNYCKKNPDCQQCPLKNVKIKIKNDSNCSSQRPQSAKRRIIGRRFSQI